MILSVSRRTDIPAFYSDWFFNRIKEGFLYVRNPMNIHAVSKITLSPDIIDCIVFWTKNPQPMLERLSEIDNYNYYFQFTINPYDDKLERLVPKKTQIFDTFKRLSDIIGPERIVWRYDPILVSDTIDTDYHTKYFEAIAKHLKGYTNRCVVSFIDKYKKTEMNLRDTTVRELSEPEIFKISQAISRIGNEYGMEMQSCAEKIDLSAYGIVHGKCIDDVLIENIIHRNLSIRKDKNQRAECGCIESVDIGEYNTCKHNCLYCYANFKNETVLQKSVKHNPNSPLLTGELSDKDVVRERKSVYMITPNLFE